VARPGHRRLSFLAICLLAASVSPASAAAPASSGIDLAGGHFGHYRWMAAAKRADGPAGAGRQGARRPCLVLSTTWEIGTYNYRRSRNRQCAGSSGLSASEPPLVASGMQPSTGAQVKMTAVGMIFAPAVRRLRVTLADGSRRTIRLDRLTARQARMTGLAPFRYAAFAFRGEWCAERLVAESAGGRALWDSGTPEYPCRSAGQGAAAR
jgi:hypothetical protein